MASLLSDLEERLKSGGWTLLRNSKHQVWLHPVTRQTMTIPLKVKDTPRRRANYLGTIQRYEQTPRAELIDNAATAKPEIPKIDLRKVAAGASAAVRQTTEVIRRIDQGAKKEPDFADYLYGFIKQKEEGAQWWTVFEHIRTKAKMGRDELSRQVGFRWSPGTVRALEAGKLPGLPEQELVALCTALGAPEKVIVAMRESQLVPLTASPTVPEVSADMPVPVATEPKPQPKKEEQTPMPKPDKKKKKSHKGGWSCPPSAEICKLRTDAKKSQEEVASSIGIDLDRYRSIEAGSIKFTVTQFSKFKQALGMLKTPYQLLKEKKAAKDGVKKAPSVPQEPSTRLGGAQGAPRDRKAVIERATQLLGSPRITNDEANTLLNGLESGFLDLLLKL